MRRTPRSRGSTAERQSPSGIAWSRPSSSSRPSAHARLLGAKHPHILHEHALPRKKERPVHDRTREIKINRAGAQTLSADASNARRPVLGKRGVTFSPARKRGGKGGRAAKGCLISGLRWMRVIVHCTSHETVPGSGGVVSPAKNGSRACGLTGAERKGGVLPRLREAGGIRGRRKTGRGD